MDVDGVNQRAVLSCEQCSQRLPQVHLERRTNPGRVRTVIGDSRSHGTQRDPHQESQRTADHERGVDISLDDRGDTV